MVWTKQEIEAGIRDIWKNAVMRPDGVVEVSWLPPTWNRCRIFEFKPGTHDYNLLLEIIGPMQPGEKREFWIDRINREWGDEQAVYPPDLLLALFAKQDEPVRVCMHDDHISLSLGPSFATTLTFPPDWPQYQTILDHTGPLAPGQEWVRLQKK